MRSRLTALALSLLYTTISATPVVVDTVKDVSYMGYNRNGSDSFLNIPFGQDTGFNRFGPPVAFVPAAGTVFNNTEIGKACPQTTGGDFTYNTILSPGGISEDCLNLKVVRPEFANETSKLPVMV